MDHINLENLYFHDDNLRGATFSEKRFWYEKIRNVAIHDPATEKHFQRFEVCFFGEKVFQLFFVNKPKSIEFMGLRAEVPMNSLLES